VNEQFLNDLNFEGWIYAVLRSINSGSFAIFAAIRRASNNADEQIQLSSNFREIKRELVKPPRPHA
jgi:hypothetical protein